MTTSGPPVDPLLQNGSPDQSSDPVVHDVPVDRATDSPKGLPSRPIALVAVGVLAALATLASVFITRGEEQPTPRTGLAIDGWAPYWALDDSVPQMSRRAASMREISPFWFKVTGITEIEIHKNAPLDLIEKFLANTGGARVVPSLVDRLPAGVMAAILADPSTRQRHVDAIVAFAEFGGFDGIDLNYEQFAFADGRETWETTRPNWVSFVAELADKLHDDGRTLTVSIPVVYDDGRTSESGYWVYDYGAIVDHVDHIRIMAYDYSVGEPGPIAPLDYVKRAIEGAVEATGQPEKLVLGIPAYGKNWLVSTKGTCPRPDKSRNIEVPETTTVTARSVADLIGRRDASPEYDKTTAEWSFSYKLEITDGTSTCVQSRRVHYVDAQGVRARMELAKKAGFDGIALWALGFEDESLWNTIVIDATPPPSSTTTQP